MKSTNEQILDLTTRIDYGVKLGAARARLEHKLAGRSIFVYENGKVIEIPPGQIEVNEPNKEF